MSLVMQVRSQPTIRKTGHLRQMMRGGDQELVSRRLDFQQDKVKSDAETRLVHRVVIADPNVAVCNAPLIEESSIRQPGASWLIPVLLRLSVTLQRASRLEVD